jgi:hypothetical protein
MTKKRYFTISKKGRYGMDEPIFRFENLDGAMEMFKYLMAGKVIELDRVAVPDNKETPDKDGWVRDTYLHVEKGEPEYHLGSEVIEVYTEEEVKKIEKEREEWKKTFKKKGGKK